MRTNTIVLLLLFALVTIVKGQLYLLKLNKKEVSAFQIDPANAKIVAQENVTVKGEGPAMDCRYPFVVSSHKGKKFSIGCGGEVVIIDYMEWDDDKHWEYYSNFYYKGNNAVVVGASQVWSQEDDLDACFRFVQKNEVLPWKFTTFCSYLQVLAGWAQTNTYDLNTSFKAESHAGLYSLEGNFKDYRFFISTTNGTSVLATFNPTRGYVNISISESDLIGASSFSHQNLGRLSIFDTPSAGLYFYDGASATLSHPIGLCPSDKLHVRVGSSAFDPALKRFYSIVICDQEHHLVTFDIETKAVLNTVSVPADMSQGLLGYKI